jgi:hypothetical protein
MRKGSLSAAVIVALVAVGLAAFRILTRDDKDFIGTGATVTEKDFAEFAAKSGMTNQPIQAMPTPVALDLSKPLRLAIGGLGLPDDEQNRQLGDLISVDLNGAKGLNLLDRQSLDAILKEMNLTLSGLVRAQDAIRVGKLLRADWFLLGTSTTFQGTNSIVVRLVDARTGVMRDGEVFPQKAVTELATNLAGFVLQSRLAAAEARPRLFLAIGTFEDLSVNNRQADFPTQLRGYLTAAYQNGSVTLLEREQVALLQQEMRLGPRWPHGRRHECASPNAIGLLAGERHISIL